MCGRFALAASPEEVAELLSLEAIEAFPPRYNIAPTQPILVVERADSLPEPRNAAGRAAFLVRWGLIPAYAKDPRDVPLLINARAETAAEKPAFRGAMRHRRCLIPATGFYEWRRHAGKKGEPYLIRRPGGGPFAFAGLRETFMAADGSEIDTAAILTTRANRDLSGIHERMPVTVPEHEFARWLDCRNQAPRDVADLLEPAPEDAFEAVAISTLVNKVSNTGPELQQPLEFEEETAKAAEAPEQPSLF